MGDAAKDLFDWIDEYYYGTDVSDETVRADAESCIEFMKSRGWYFEMMPLDK